MKITLGNKTYIIKEGKEHEFKNLFSDPYSTRLQSWLTTNAILVEDQSRGELIKPTLSPRDLTVLGG